ncbi:MAG: bi-domain-containing oxidoreductase [Candidatus Manganitrophaceae bacterium]
MKQVVQHHRSGVLEVQEVPAPSLQPGGLLVANCASLISAGTEKATVHLARKSLAGKAMERPDLVRKVLGKIRKEGMADTFRMVFERLETPAALGYSCAGTVLDLGREVVGFSSGDRVACAGQNYASHAEVVMVPKNLSVKIPDGVEFEEAAFVTLGAIALQGVRQTEARLGERIAVIGLGLLGQLTVQLLKAAGCSVLASDLDPVKLKPALALGADVVAEPNDLVHAASEFTEGHGVDAVLLTASTKENGPVEIAGEIARRKGRVVVVGAVGMTLPREPYYKKELELRLSTSYGPGRYDREYEEKGRDYPYGYVRWTERRNMEAFLALIQQRKIDVRSLISHRFPIEKGEEAYRLMMEGSESYLGIIVTYPPVGGTGRDRLGRIVPVRPARTTTGLQLGIIGAGNHVKDRLLPVLKAMEAVSIRAVCTGTGLHAKAVAEKTGAAYCTSDYREVLKDDAVNAVLIGTRHHDHGPMVLEALRAGKHVFVEKPLCLSEAELEEITSLYAEKAKKGVQLTVGFNRRFSPHMLEARGFFQDRKNPLVMFFRVNAGAIPFEHWIQDLDVGGGRIVGEACHFVDFMQALCGAVPVSVHARRIGRHRSGITDDQSLLSFSFGDGSIGTVLYTAGGDPGLGKERFEAFGEGKVLIIDDFFRSEFYAGGKKRVFKTAKQEKGFQVEMARFVESITSDSGPAILFEEIRAVTRACFRAVESFRTGAVYPLEG